MIKGAEYAQVIIQTYNILQRDIILLSSVDYAELQGNELDIVKEKIRMIEYELNTIKTKIDLLYYP